jgi:hypothetical protein
MARCAHFVKVEKLHLKTLNYRWAYAHSHLFKDKKVIEVGAGPGLLSVVLDEYCKEIIATDYLDIVNHYRVKYLDIRHAQN